MVLWTARVVRLPDRSQRVAGRTPATPPSREQAEPAAPRPAEATGKSEHDEHTTATNHCETPKKLKNLYMTLSLSGSCRSAGRFSAMRISRDLTGNRPRPGI